MGSDAIFRSSLQGSIRHVEEFMVRGNAEPQSAFAGRLGNSMRSHDSMRSLAGEDTPLMVGRKLEEAAAGIDAPPLVAWIGPALLCAAAYAFYNIFIKKGSASINPILGGVILQFVAALLGTVLLGGLVWKEGGAEVITYDYWGVFWAVCAGLAVGVAEMLSFCVSGMGVQATQSIPIIIGGSVMFGSVLGAVLLHEQMTMHGWSGVVLLVIGICFVATDPGVKMAAH
jgi:transporter family protein